MHKKQNNKKKLRLNNFLILIGTYFVLLCNPQLSIAQSNSAKEASNTGKLFGEAIIGNNSIEHGLTQTQNQPSYVGGIGFQFNQFFKMGIRGASVKYSEYNDHLNLKMYGEYKSIITANTNLTFKYIANKYYNTNYRSGNILGIDFDYSGYHIGIEDNDNWEGSYTHSNHITASKQWLLYPTLFAGAELGVNLVNAENKKSYLNGLGYIGHKLSNSVEISFKASLTSSPAQFSGQGNFVTFIALASVF